MKYLLQQLRYYRKETVLGPLFKLIEAMFDLLVPLVIAAMIDNGIEAKNTHYVLICCLLLALCALAGLASTVTAQYFAAKAAVGSTTRLRQVLFDKIQSLSFADLDRFGTSTLITRMTSDLNQVQSGVNLALRLFLRSPFIVFGAMVMAFTISPFAGVLFAVTIVALFLVVYGILFWSMAKQKHVRSGLDSLTSLTRENLTGVRVIRAFCRENAETEEFSKRNDRFNHVQRVCGRILALLNPVTFFLLNLAAVLLLHFGAIRVNTGSLTQGQMIALYNYLTQILVELIKLANLTISVSKAVTSAGRVGEVLDAVSTLQTEAPAKELPASADADAQIVFSDVSFAYPGAGADSLSHISFRIPRGQTFGIIGGTGSGKSTLVHLIPHFYDATSGTVLLDGKPVQCYTQQQLADKIGVVLQKTELFAGTIRDNLKFSNPDADDATLLAAMDAAQASDILTKKEAGLDTDIGQGGRALSGGQRQRISIARALVKHPEILILDDSSSALDYATDAHLRHALQHLPGNPTVILISQRVASIRHADQILVLDNGHAVGLGTHAQLLKNCPVYAEICQSQEKNAQRVGEEKVK